MDRNGEGAGEVLAACQGLPQREFQDQDKLLVEGDCDGRLFVLISGTLSIRKGRSRVAEISEAGSMFGEISALLGTPCTADVVAAGDVRVFCIEDGAAFLAGHPDLALCVARLLAQRLTDATQYLADLKDQYADWSGHFGMMDRILEKLLHAPVRHATAPGVRPEDARL